MGHLELGSYVFYSAYLRALSDADRQEIGEILTPEPGPSIVTHLVGIAVLAVVVGAATLNWL